MDSKRKINLIAGPSKKIDINVRRQWVEVLKSRLLRKKPAWPVRVNKKGSGLGKFKEKYAHVLEGHEIWDDYLRSYPTWHNEPTSTAIMKEAFLKRNHVKPEDYPEGEIWILNLIPAQVELNVSLRGSNNVAPVIAAQEEVVHEDVPIQPCPMHRAPPRREYSLPDSDSDDASGSNTDSEGAPLESLDKLFEMLGKTEDESRMFAKLMERQMSNLPDYPFTTVEEFSKEFEEYEIWESPSNVFNEHANTKPQVQESNSLHTTANLPPGNVLDELFPPMDIQLHHNDNAVPGPSRQFVPLEGAEVLREDQENIEPLEMLQESFEQDEVLRSNRMV